MDSAIVVRGGRQRILVFSAVVAAATENLPAGRWEKFDVRVGTEPWATLWHPHDVRPGPLFTTERTTDADYDPRSPDPNDLWYGAAWSLGRPLGGLWWPLGWLAGTGGGWWLAYEAGELRWRDGSDWDGGDVTDGAAPSASVEVWGVRL